MMMLIAAAALFAIFACNVVLGSADMTPFLGDVGEMLVLFASTIVFVAAILRKETAEKNKTGG